MNLRTDFVKDDEKRPLRRSGSAAPAGGKKDNLHKKGENMEPVKARDIPTEKKIFSDAWQLLTQYYNLSLSDDTGWSDALQMVKKICLDVESNPAAFELAKEINMAVITYIERRQMAAAEKPK